MLQPKARHKPHHDKHEESAKGRKLPVEVAFRTLPNAPTPSSFVHFMHDRMLQQHIDRGPFVRHRMHHAMDDGFQRGRNIARQIFRQRLTATQTLPQAPIRWKLYIAGQLECGYTEAKNIGRLRVPALHQLRGHVARVTFGRVPGITFRQIKHDPEIGQLAGTIVCDQNIIQLDVQMDQIAIVQAFQSEQQIQHYRPNPLVRTAPPYTATHDPGSIMSSGVDFKGQILKVRRELQLSCDAKSLLRTLKETQRCLDGIANEPNYAVCVAHLVKELLDWIAIKEDRDLQTVAAKECLELLEAFLKVCHQADCTTRSYLVARLYNAIVALIRKDDSRGRIRTKLYVARLMNQFPIEDDQADLFVRVKQVVLKTIHEAKETKELMKEGADLVIEMQRNVLIHEANKARTATDGIRLSALTLFREVFDNGLAILCRLHAVSHTKAQLLYQIIMRTMLMDVKPDERELISLLGDSVGFVETILANAGRENEDYYQFTEFFTIFKDIRREPYASCYQLVSMVVQLVKQIHPTEQQIEDITKHVRSVHATFPDHQLVVRIAIFITCQAIPYLYRLPQEFSLAVSAAAIGLCEALMHFVRQCPSDTVPELCRMCTSSRRHLADKLLSTVMQLSIVQARNATDQHTDLNKLSYSVSRSCELIKRKLALLEELGCERKRALLDSTMRQSISWLKLALTLLREDCRATEETVEIAHTIKQLISVQNRYRFEFLSDLYLVRLLENSYIDRPGTGGSCWANVSIRMLKLLLTLRDASSSTASSTEEQRATISTIVRSIMCYQMNAPETDPVRTLTILQLYDHASFDRHGFTFDCTPTRAEKVAIFAEEMALVIKYKTSNTLPAWDYMVELSKVVDVSENCLSFGMALHGFSENDAAKLPEPLMDTLMGALKAYKPINTLERIKRIAALGIISYYTFSSVSRTLINRLRDIPFKTDHLRNGQIDEILIENQLDRETILFKRMETIRLYYGELMATLAEESFQSLWVLPSVTHISSILDNIARLYHLNYHPHRAVELQWLNLLLVSQRRDTRPLDQCSSLAFLLEQHQLADVQLKKAHYPPNAGGTLATLEDLANRAISLLPPSGSIDDVPDNRKLQLLNLHLGLALYYASRSELEKALRLIQRALDHLDRSSDVGTIKQLFQGRTAQIIFRLVTEYGLPWPDTVPSLVFMKRMLSSFSELQKLSSEHMFTLSLATVDMTVDVLQYLIVRYDTGPMIEPYLEQLLKFVLRRGAGLRAMQLLLLYGQMYADMQKLDRCEIILLYLDRLLMLRSILPEVDKENGKLIDHPSLAVSHKSVHQKVINSLPISGHTLIIDDLVDVEREAAPKHRIVSTFNGGRSPARNELTIDETNVQQYLMFRHSSQCDCRYCSYPQYKTMAYQTAALAVRLSVLQQTKSMKHIERDYGTLIEHWRVHVYPEFLSWNVPVYRTDLSVAVIRTLVHRGQFLVRQQLFDRAREVYGNALKLIEHGIDPALVADVRYNIKALDFLVQRPLPQSKMPRPKRSPSMIKERYAELLARKGKTNGGTPDMGLLTANLSNLTMKTPKTVSKEGVRTRAPPKTVDRVNELLRQATSRRHHQKTTDSDGMPVPDGIITKRTYSASARKPKTVNVFVDSPPNLKGSGPEIPATVGKMFKPTSIPSTMSVGKSKTKLPKPEFFNENNETKARPDSKMSTKAKESYRRTEKRGMIRDPPPEIPESLTSYKDALVKETPTRTADGNNMDGRKVRRLLIEEFPCLSVSSDSDVSAHTPQTARTRTDSPATLNGSFRDALVLGGATKRDSDSSEAVIVLDDSNDSSGRTEEVIETSFEHSHAVSADKRTGLSLKSYSDRKRLPTPASSAVRSVATKRRTPLLAAKTKLTFDEPSPEPTGHDAAVEGNAINPAPVAAHANIGPCWLSSSGGGLSIMNLRFCSGHSYVSGIFKLSTLRVLNSPKLSTMRGTSRFGISICTQLPSTAYGV
uniref:Separase n=1 Tax=Anopheles culicifacies TaxID=139723 RepID=A0A182MRT7_9DIPT